MNVRTKLLVKQSLNVALIVGVALIAVVIAQRFDYHVRRAELAYDERQTITMLAVQAFHYKTAIGDVLLPGGGRPGELDLARRDLRQTLQQLARQTEQETVFLAAEDRPPEFEETERLGRLESAFADIDRSVDRVFKLKEAGSDDDARQLQQLIEQRFDGEIAELLAAAMADEQEEVVRTDAEIAELAERRVVFLVVAGLSALTISLAMGVFLYRSISRPMQRLLSGVRALRSGNLQHRVVWQGADEFAELASQFNEMAATLEDRGAAPAWRPIGTRAAGGAAHRRVGSGKSAPQISGPPPAAVPRRGQPRTANAGNRPARRSRRHAPRPADIAGCVSWFAGTHLAAGRANGAPDRRPAVPGPIGGGHGHLRQAARRSPGVVANAVQDGTVLAQGKRISVTEKLPGQPVWVNADAQRLRQAVLIAIDNAIKYSDSESAVEVSLTIRNARAAITVLDHGTGVPPEELPYVFERFYRIRGGMKRRPDGSGLGLPIAKWIAEKHDGTISLTSTPGRSTALTIELPRLDSGGP